MTRENRRNDVPQAGLPADGPLDAYLQGDLAFEELPPELQEDESRLRALMAQLDVGVQAPAGLRQDVMREIDALR